MHHASIYFDVKELFKDNFYLCDSQHHWQLLLDSFNYKTLKDEMQILGVVLKLIVEVFKISFLILKILNQ